MACFLVPMTEAIVTTIAQKVIESKEKKTGIKTVTSADGKYWDTVLISNPGRFQRETAQSLEQELRLFWEELLPASNSGKLGVIAWDWIRTKLPANG